MKKIIFLLAVLALVAGCVQQAQIEDSAVFEMKRFGAFSPQDMAVTEVRIEPGKLTYTAYSYQDEVTLQVQKNITSEQYNSILSAFNKADFKSLPTNIEPEAEVTDVGEANLTLSYDGYRKTVNIDPYFTPEISGELASLLEEMEGMIMFAMDMSSEEAEEFAADWIRGSPTYAYDGSGLELVEHQVLESYPVQHVMTYEFTSSHAGYGDRSDQMTAQVITPHTVEIKVSSHRIVSAVMDDKWDALNQQPLEQVPNPEDQHPPARPIAQEWLSYQPMQCEKTPWQEWYEEGNIQFVKEPTDEELISAYYSDLGIEVKDITKVESDKMVCQACNVCPTSHYYTMKVSPGSAEGLQGWKPVNETR